MGRLTSALRARERAAGLTNVEFLRKGIETGTANSILVKVNQIGSLTETFDAVEYFAGDTAPTAVTVHALCRVPAR